MDIYLKGNSHQRRVQRRRIIRDLVEHEILIEQKPTQLVIIRDERNEPTNQQSQVSV